MRNLISKFGFPFSSRIVSAYVENPSAKSKGYRWIWEPEDLQSFHSLIRPEGCRQVLGMCILSWSFVVGDSLAQDLGRKLFWLKQNSVDCWQPFILKFLACDKLTFLVDLPLWQKLSHAFSAFFCRVENCLCDSCGEALYIQRRSGNAYTVWRETNHFSGTAYKIDIFIVRFAYSPEIIPWESRHFHLWNANWMFHSRKLVVLSPKRKQQSLFFAHTTHQLAVGNVHTPEVVFRLHSLPGNFEPEISTAKDWSPGGKVWWTRNTGVRPRSNLSEPQCTSG